MEGQPAPKTAASAAAAALAGLMAVGTAPATAVGLAAAAVAVPAEVTQAATLLATDQVSVCGLLTNNHSGDLCVAVYNIVCLVAVMCHWIKGCLKYVSTP